MIGPKAQTVMSVTDFHPSQSPLGPPNPCSIVMATKPPKEFADESSVGDSPIHNPINPVLNNTSFTNNAKIGNKNLPVEL